MSWIVLGEEKGKIKLVSKSNVSGLLPKGSYLTIDQGESKFILRVDNSVQTQPYSPSPLIIDMDLTALKQDQKCQNIIYSARIKEINRRKDGLIDFLRPQSIARRSNQEEIDLAISNNENGPKVFPATIYASENQLLTDESGNYISISLSEDMFYHQILICGKTGSGKTVATKSFAQYFVEDLGGCVLAINVKEADFLRMNEASRTINKSLLKEWENLNSSAHGIENFMIYYPASTIIPRSKKVNMDLCQKITLDVKKIDPESLIGLLEGISDMAAQSLPNIFRCWQNTMMEIKNPEDFTFHGFLDYFNAQDDRVFDTMNVRGEISSITLHPGTYQNIQRNLDRATEFFDNKDAKTIDETDILVKGKMSVIDVANKNGIQFGSILLRDLLNKIVNSKSKQEYEVPILIIIDEVHQFYKNNSATEAIGDLDTICRTGRSMKIGVIFSSQTPEDIPKGLSAVINTKIFFKSDTKTAKKFGINIKNEEMDSLKKGFACCSIFDLTQLKIIKFPLAYAGVFEED